MDETGGDAGRTGGAGGERSTKGAPDKVGNTVTKQLDVLSVIVPQTWGRCGIVQPSSTRRYGDEERRPC